MTQIWKRTLVVLVTRQPGNDTTGSSQANALCLVLSSESLFVYHRLFHHALKSDRIQTGLIQEADELLCVFSWYWFNQIVQFWFDHSYLLMIFLTNTWATHGHGHNLMFNVCSGIETSSTQPNQQSKEHIGYHSFNNQCTEWSSSHSQQYLLIWEKIKSLFDLQMNEIPSSQHQEGSFDQQCLEMLSLMVQQSWMGPNWTSQPDT